MAFGERGAARLAARIDHADAVTVALAVEGHRVEIADEPGAEHADLVLLHGTYLRVAEVKGRRRSSATSIV